LCALCQLTQAGGSLVRGRQNGQGTLSGALTRGAFSRGAELDGKEELAYNNDGVAVCGSEGEEIGMDWGKLFEFNGLNLWVVASGNGLNLILEGMTLLLTALLGTRGAETSQLLLMVGSFLSTGLVAFICGRMERERYVTYAAYTLPGNLLLTIPSILFGGIMGILVVLVSVLGAFNGARLAEMTVERHAR